MSCWFWGGKEKLAAISLLPSLSLSHLYISLPLSHSHSDSLSLSVLNTFFLCYYGKKKKNSRSSTELKEKKFRFTFSWKKTTNFCLKSMSNQITWCITENILIPLVKYHVEIILIYIVIILNSEAGEGSSERQVPKWLGQSICLIDSWASRGTVTQCASSCNCSLQVKDRQCFVSSGSDKYGPDHRAYELTDFDIFS